MEGFGVLRTVTNDEYRGQFKNGFKHGKGKVLYSNGVSSYDGDWNYNKIEGKGISFDNQGNKYEGEFAGNLRNGKGQCTFVSDGSKLIGQWSYNLFQKG